MPCRKCSSDFNLFNWKIKCGECEDKYCTKCLKRREGILYCEKCLILLKHPPDRSKLMELKSKDLQDYLTKRNISTKGLVEKHELVDIFCNKHIPEKPKKGVDKLTANFAGSLPNLRPLNDLLGNVETVLASNPSTAGTHYSETQHTAKPTQSTLLNQPQDNTNSGAEQPTTSSFSNEAFFSTPSPKDEEENPCSTPPRYPNIDDFDNVDELQNLSSKDLKILLTLNRVDFKGCVEKSELLERAERLWEHNNEQKREDTDALPVNELCKLCMDAPLDCVLLECGHIATCIDCGKRLAECPICRQYVVRVVRTFKA